MSSRVNKKAILTAISAQGFTTRADLDRVFGVGNGEEDRPKLISITQGLYELERDGRVKYVGRFITKN